MSAIFQRRRHLEGLDLANMLVNVIIDKKGSNILLLDIRDQAVFSDYFIICNGESDRQLKSLMDAVIESAREEAGTRPRGTEGEPDSGWILVDLGAVMVHLFSPEKREYYSLEDIWSDGHVVLRMQ